MDTMGKTAPVTEEDVRVLARAAGLPLRPGSAATLAAGLESDLSAVRRLRAVDAGETHPAGVTSPPGGRADARD